MTTTTHHCIACKKEVDADHLVVFGDDVVCADCKDNYVQCLKEGLEPTFNHGIWRHKRFVLCEQNADLTTHCLCCNEPASTSKTLHFNISAPFKLQLQSTDQGELDIGFCKGCRKKLNRYSILSTTYMSAFAFGFLGPMVLGWINSPALNHLFIACYIVAIPLLIIRLFLLSEPSASCQHKTKLIRIFGTGRVFRETRPPIPASRLHETRE